MIVRSALFALSLALGLAPAGRAWAQDLVRIGLSVPLTGADAPYGLGIRQGAEQAVADLNRSGPRRFTLSVADDGGDPRQAATVAARLGAEGVAAVIGPFESPAVAAAAPVYEKVGTVVMTTGASYGPLTGRGLWNLFRLGPSDPQQARAAADYLAKTVPGRAIAILNDRTSFGRGLSEVVAARWRELGQKDPLVAGFDRGTTDLAALAKRLAEAQVAAVYFGGLAPDAVNLVRAMREAKVEAPLVSSDGILDPAFAALGAAGEGTVMTLAPDASRLPDSRGGKPASRTPEAETVAAGAYAAVQIIAQALDRAAVLDPRSAKADGHKLAEALRSGSFRTIAGPVAFDARGDQTGEPVVLRIWHRQPDGRLDYAGQDPATEAGRPQSSGPGLN
jgi:branched-chain amino acid transport system substrate-binding protein